MGKTIIVSNRLPFEFKIKPKGLEIEPSIGGLATGLNTVHAEGNSLWIGWSGQTEQKLKNKITEKDSEYLSKERYVLVPLDEDDVTDFYAGFSNKALWPLFHYFIQYAIYDPKQWLAYKRVNEKFADSILEHAQEGDQIWVQDYHLLLLPQMIRERNPSLTIGFFLHIPFPSFECFRTCPWREELLMGMLGSDLIGFHTYDYVQHFLDSVKRLLGLQVKLNEIIHDDGRAIKVDSFPMGIDYNKFHQAAQQHKLPDRQKTPTISRLEKHALEYSECKFVLSIDRMDYTKGIPNRIRDFECFLEKYPQYFEKVQLIMIAVPSRSDVPQYRNLKKETDELVGRINSKYSTITWTPILYFYQSFPFDDLVDLYSFSDIALITPLRDGMNLVAKEYIASRTNQDGVLILSEMAGAASELLEALLINPNNKDQFADVLKQAIEMSTTEQQLRMKAMQQHLSQYNVANWATSFLKALSAGPSNIEKKPSRRLTAEIQKRLLSSFSNAKSKLLLFDYDGTLVPICQNPDEAVPDELLYDLLDKINEDPNTELVVISGRGRPFIEKWFGAKNYTLITDHGVWLRRHQSWEKLENPKTKWKEVIRPILENFVDNTPGAFIEEKKYSLAWHYRKVSDYISNVRVQELKILLNGLVIENGLSVLEGSKVLEVKDYVVNKGRAVTKLLVDQTFDFILAIGDDHTDEYMFAELPPFTFTIKIGKSETLAQYFLPDQRELGRVLELFIPP